MNLWFAAVDEIDGGFRFLQTYHALACNARDNYLLTYYADYHVETSYSSINQPIPV